MSSTAYLYANDRGSALERLKVLEAIEDPETIATLQSLGDIPGLRCLEVGAGAGSIARWLAGRVGPDGHVLATDADARLLQDSAGPTLEVRSHDISRDPLPRDAFDLIHVRHTLIHLGNGLARALDTLHAALRPDGTAVLEESDFEGACAAVGTPPELSNAYNAGLQAILQLYRQRGMDVHIGATLTSALQRRRLTVLTVSRHHRLVRGGTPEALFHRATYAQAREAVLECNLASAETIDALIAAHANPDLHYRSRQTVTVIATKLP